ncbi:MAG: hypothetical protein AAF806_26995 [Bacteroidota bacterium]
MRPIYGLVLMVFVQFSCKNEVLNAFEEANQSLLDSIAIYDTLNSHLFEQLDPNELRMRKAEGEFSALVYYGFKKQNQSIDRVIQLISEKAVNRNDRTVSTRYLVKAGKAEEIRTETNNLLSYVEVGSPYHYDLPEAAKQLIWSINDYKKSDNETWAESKFLNMPMIASKSLLNRFKLNNSKASALILLDLKQEIIYNENNNSIIDNESE